MPRPLVYSNGRMLIGMDSCGQIRDLTYPKVGLYNHVAGYPQKVGIWVNGIFSWLTDSGWTHEFNYQPQSMVGVQTHTHSELGLQLEYHEALHPEKTTFARQIHVTNFRQEPVEVRYFVYHDLRMEESEIGDCSLYVPMADAIVHFKGPHCLLFTGKTDEGGLYQYTTGHRGFESYLGSWEDCQDGVLSFHPIAQGMVDSAISLRFELEPLGKSSGEYWIVAERSVDASVETLAAMRKKGLPALLKESTKNSKALVKRVSGKFQGLPNDLKDFCERSLLILLTQLDHDGGILAANDSDIMVTNKAHYSYVWPRDSALVARALDAVGLPEFVHTALDFCARLEIENRGYFYQKYRIDGTLGCTWHPWITENGLEVPCQQDETALTLLAMIEYAERNTADVSAWSKPMEAMANWLLAYRDPKTGLPLQSHDLWEERRGIHTFTVATVICAFDACARMYPKRAKEFSKAAADMRKAMLKDLWDDKRGCFYRRLWYHNGRLEADTAIDSSTLLVGILGALPIDHPAVQSNAKAVTETLWISNGIGGIGRYPGDWYFRLVEDAPGNPWIICTQWLAQTLAMQATSLDQLEKPTELLQWALERAETSGVMAEQFHPKTGQPLSVAPLTWSHAEVVQTGLMLASKHRELGPTT